MHDQTFEMLITNFMHAFNGGVLPASIHRLFNLTKTFQSFVLQYLKKMGASVSRTDFEWSYTDEPHATRRKQILSKSRNRWHGHQITLTEACISKYVIVNNISIKLLIKLYFFQNQNVPLTDIYCNSIKIKEQ